MSRDKTPERAEFVVGFALDDMNGIALIQKNRPEWQAGLLNGIGGHIEQGENPIDAMRREFTEETGLTVKDWTLMVEMEFPGAVIYFFKSRVPHQVLDLAESKTDERVLVMSIGHVSHYATVPNLAWLIPLAACTADDYAPFVVSASVAEVIEPTSMYVVDQ